MRPEYAVARVCTVDGRAVGLAFLAGGGRLITCAHVVNSALGRPRRSLERPDAPVRLRFPFDEHGTAYEAGVTRWAPDSVWREANDLAVLRVRDGLPAGLPALTLARAVTGADVPVAMCGADGEDGLRHVRGVLVGEKAPGRHQINQEKGGAFRVAPGFSGSPVWHRQTGEVVGVLRAARDASAGSDAECLALSAIRRPPRPDGAVDVLHVGALLLDAQTGPARIEALCADVAETAGRLALAPDLIAFTGNLTAGALPSQFTLVLQLVRRLSTELEVPVERIVVVPGPTDVSHIACRAYFLACEASEEEPVPPYWDKWRPYSAFREALYGRGLSRDMPWTFDAYEELRVVVAGMNSTMAHTHLDQHAQGRYTPRQAAYFTERVTGAEYDDWTRLAVTHHEAAANGEPHAFGLRIADAPGYRLARLHMGRALMWGRLPDGDGYAADPALDGAVRDLAPRPRADRADTRSARRDDPELTRVVAALRLQQPDAELDIVPREDFRSFPYIRVVTRHDFHDGLGPVPTGEYVVGVAIRSDLSTSDIELFRHTVLERLRTPGAETPARLVHFGGLPADEVAAYARSRNVHLVSFARFQFDWDPRAFTAWQARSLAADRRYPPELYIPQRFREVGGDGQYIDEYGRLTREVSNGLSTRVEALLGEDESRLVVVIGSAGSGKTFFLRMLTDALSSADGGITPVYLQLRDLERIPDLDEIVAGRFARAQETRLTIDRFDYFLREGRIALLLDGLDELTAQNTYDKALAYLGQIRDKATGRAKIVVTARDVEFLSNREVLRVLGRNRAILSGRRVLHVEDFDMEQVHEFLVRVLGGEAAATERLDLLATLGSIPEVARNPRMLSFIADIEPDRLRRAAADSGGEMNSAELYRQVLDQWMTREEERLKRPGQTAAMTRAELWEATTRLAVHLWTTERERISVEELGQAAGILSRVNTDAQVHQLGSGSLLIRYEDGELGFIHRSVQEWLLAKAMLDDPFLGNEVRLSGQAAKFYAEMLPAEPAPVPPLPPYDPAGLPPFDPTVLPRVDQSYMQSNTGLVRGWQGAPEPAAYGQADLRGTDFQGQTLSGGDFRDADLRGTDLAGRDLAHADFTGADLTGASLLGANLRGARFNGAKLERAALLGATYEPMQLAGAETYGAALPGRRLTFESRPVKAGRAVAVNPQGTVIATGNEYGWVQLWSVPDLAPIRSWRGAAGAIRALCWSPDGLQVLVGGREPLRCWNAASGEVAWEREMMADAVVDLAWNQPGDAIAIATTGPERVNLMAPGGVVRWDPFDLGAVTDTDLTWSPDGTMLAIGTVRGRLTVLIDGVPVALPTASELVRPVFAWARRSKLLAYGDTRAGVRALNPRDLETPSSFVTTLPCDALAWSEDGTRILVGDSEGPIREILFDGADVETWIERLDGVHVVAYAGDHVFVSARPDQMRVWDRRTNTVSGAHLDRPNGIHSLAWSPDGGALVAGDQHGTLRRWDLGTGTSPWHESAWNTRLLTDWGADGRIATGDRNGQIQLWDRVSGAVQAQWSNNASLDTLCWSPDASMLVTSDVSGQLRVWSMAGTGDGQLIRHWPMRKPVDDVRWLDGKRLVAVADRRLVALDINAQEPLWQVNHAARLPTLSVDAAEQVVHVGNAQGLVTAFRGDSGERLVRWRVADAAITSLASANLPGVLASACEDGTVRLWLGQEPVATWTAHSGRTTTVAFNPTATRLATCGDDGLVRIWDAVDGKHLATLIGLRGSGSAAVVGEDMRTFKLDGSLDGEFWYASGLVAMDPGELALHTNEVARLGPEEPLGLG